MLRYFDKCCQPIQQSTWWKHLLDPDYSGIFTHTTDTFEVRAEWLGVASLRERKPGLFLVRVWDLVRETDGKGSLKTVRTERRDCVWTETAEAAIEEAEAKVAELYGDA